MIIGIDLDAICQAQGFASEKELQDLIEKQPQILNPIADLNRPGGSLMILGREFSVQSGAIDFLACDVDANLVLIETKMAENPELRRMVIGQIMEYSSNLRDMPFATWRIRCEQYLRRPLDAAVQQFFTSELSETGGSSDASAFVDQLQRNLQEGQLSIAVITNRINFEIQRLFSFLDEKTSDTLNFIVIEVNKYDLGGKTYVHANVVWAAKYIRSLFSRKMISEDKYLQSKTILIRDIIGTIDRWCTDRGMQKVPTTKGISWKIETGGSIYVSNDWLDTNWSTIQADSEEIRRVKMEQIKMARSAGFQIHSGKHGGFRTMLNESLTMETAIRFLELAYAVLECGQRVCKKNPLGP